MVDKTKREFCTKYFFRQAAKIISEFNSGIQEAKEKENFDKFFESYESSYALTLAYPDDLLLETASQHGIETEGREKSDIVKELFKKHGGKEYGF